MGMGPWLRVYTPGLLFCVNGSGFSAYAWVYSLEFQSFWYSEFSVSGTGDVVE